MGKSGNEEVFGRMAKGNGQKLKLMYLWKILREKTDETHSITMQEIIDSLGAYDISAERKSLYNDIECLRTFGIDVIGEKQDRTFYYRIGSREFELPELKLLVDSVQSAKFITTKKSTELIKKIEGFASKYEAGQLHRQVYVNERIKTENENIYYNVDEIYNAIAHNTKISFQYYNWDENKQQVLRKEGERYLISPWGLAWDNENYYLIAFDSEEEKIKHFRVDKMLNIDESRERREGSHQFQRFDTAIYTNKMFGMFHGEEELVRLECENKLAGVIIDRFGQQLNFMKMDSEHFQVCVKVAVSRQFLSWVLALGEGAKILGPSRVVEKVREEIQRLSKQYEV